MTHSTDTTRTARAVAAAAGLALAAAGCAEGRSTLGLDEGSRTGGPRFVENVDPIPNRYIVALESGGVATAAGGNVAGRRAEVEALARTVATDYAGKVVHDYSEAFVGFSAEMSADDARALSEDPRVAFVEEDIRVEANDIQSGATFGLDRIDQLDLPLDGDYEFSADGSGVSVFVIDTGIRTSHQDFGGRAREGFSAIEDGRGAQDCNGHGTHVAGTVGSETFGVAKGAELVAVRVLGCDGGGSASGVIAGIDFVTRNAEPGDVANMSLGGGASLAIDRAVQRSVEAGVHYAVAAGNESRDACAGSPARVADAVTVGATTSRDRRASFSNFGDCVDVFAPGQGIESLSDGSDTATATLSGTSMASPHVAGVAALVSAENPGATPAEVKAAIEDAATTGRLDGIGAGSPNRLLFTGFIADGGGDDGGGGDGGGGDGGGDDDDGGGDGGDGGGDTTGTPRSGSSTGFLRPDDLDRYVPLPVVPGTTVDVQLSGAGDPDLYVRFDAEPTASEFDCAPRRYGASETCSLEVPSGAQEVFLLVYGVDFASYRLDVEWVEP